jgi:hypothetical protein
VADELHESHAVEAALAADDLAKLRKTFRLSKARRDSGSFV